MVKAYIPEQGDVVILDFNPTKGHEQRGVRPALIISHKQYNAKSGQALVCPITSTIKGYSFESPVEGGEIKGVVLVDQVRSIDWKARNTKFVEKANTSVIRECTAKLSALFS